MGQHRQALEIYVFKLDNPAKAEEWVTRTLIIDMSISWLVLCKGTAIESIWVIPHLPSNVQFHMVVLPQLRTRRPARLSTIHFFPCTCHRHMVMNHDMAPQSRSLHDMVPGYLPAPLSALSQAHCQSMTSNSTSAAVSVQPTASWTRVELYPRCIRFKVQKQRQHCVWVTMLAATKEETAASPSAKIGCAAIVING